VIAVGIDLVSVPDVRQSCCDFGERYLRRVYTAHELEECGQSADPAPRLAARFAAKEATIKALSVEHAQPPWTSIEVWRHPRGWCEIRLTGQAARLAAERRIDRIAVSLSHEGDMAAAVVLATTAG
jgi:holo-[acyl-carrier protein] synthase